MARYHATVASRRSATETFGCLATFSDAAEWDPGVLAGEQQLDPGPAGAGPRFRLVVPFLGLRLSLTYEVIRCVPGHEVLLPPPGRAAVHGPDRGDGAARIARWSAMRPRCGCEARCRYSPRPAAGAGRRAVTGFGPVVDAAL